MKPPAIPTFRQLHAPELTPAERGNLYHQWYQYVAREYQGAGLMFMNFGYADLEQPEESTLAAGQAGNPLSASARLYTQLAALLEPQGKRLLEVGCGRGGGAYTVMRRFKPVSLDALDRSDAAIALCREQFKLPGLAFHHGSAEALPFPDASFDGVFNVESSHAYAHFDRFVAEVQRVLKPGGKFATADVRPPGEVDAWRQLLQAVGFKLIAERDITPNVVAALRATHDFKVKFVKEHVAEQDRARFLDFLGAEGSWYYEALRGHGLRYWQFMVQKPLA